MADTKPCPIHRYGMRVLVTERHDGPKCGKPGCLLQPGHDGDCEPGDE